MEGVWYRRGRADGDVDRVWQLNFLRKLSARTGRVSSIREGYAYHADCNAALVSSVMIAVSMSLLHVAAFVPKIALSVRGLGRCVAGEHMTVLASMPAMKPKRMQ